MKKLALVAAIAATTNLYAMEAMTDESLSAATGQDGITIELSTPNGITIDALFIHDKDGLVGEGLEGDAGAITLGAGAGADNMVITTTGVTTITIDADGGTTAVGDTIVGASLNVNLNMGGMTIETGSIGVAASNRVHASGTIDNYATGGLVAASNINILDSLTLTLGGVEANVQLGTAHQADGAMIKLSGTITGGVEIADFALKGTGANAGELAIGNIVVKSDGSDDLVIGADINITTNGLVFTHTGGPMDIMLEAIKLGGPTHNLGDVEILGLDASDAVVTIRGH
jgi:hypothetical protein